MGAECHTCGSDIVYPVGTWPVGECPTCTRDARVRGWEDAAAKFVPFADAAEMRWMSMEDATIEVPARAVAELCRLLPRERRVSR